MNKIKKRKNDFIFKTKIYQYFKYNVNNNINQR